MALVSGNSSLFIQGRLCFTDPTRLPDIGKVLAGIQVPSEDYTEFDNVLKQLGYTFVEETNNVVYKRHLHG